MSTYAWVITRDYLDKVSAEHGKALVSGPHDATEAQLEKALMSGQPFKIYDDDGVLYYSGRCIADDMDSEDMFGPLEDYGTPNAGATEIKYREKNGMYWTL